MPDQPESGVPSAQAMQTRIHDVAQMLRNSRSVSRDVQDALAELLDELSVVLKTPNAPPAGMALIQAETHAPIAVGLARRVIDALADIGI